jgi:uncharacterized protein (TIGR02996 family)
MPTPEPASSPCQAPPGYWGEDTEGPCEANRAALAGLLRGIVQEPQAEDRCLVLADWLEEHDDTRRAELLRLHRNLLATCCEPDAHPERSSWQARIVELLAEGVKPCVPQKAVVLAPSIEMTFSFIPPGSFLMGSPEDEQGREDHEALHRVTLSQGFWLAITPVTQAQWRAGMGSPSKLRNQDCPVKRVSWDDCQGFCERVRRQTGLSLRLPAEAEWERACRAGTTTAYNTGDGVPGSTGRATRMGAFLPNGWGLYDMHFGVWEWCKDWYVAYSHGGIETVASSPHGTVRVVRGGTGGPFSGNCRSASRRPAVQFERHHDFGCRVVLCPD